ncbi:hypothetical protein B6U84_00855 [Candidatus Bathyarchaeota archaeon ex4484_40]|nr:MAG: hypothetical protein B6U84_00855 [Candidatus Bathyarchaeota archaeon ex4484_40]
MTFLKEGAESEACIHRPFIAVRYRGKTATFLWTSSPETLLRSSVDLKVRAEWDELLWLAETLNLPVKGNLIVFPSLDTYNRMLIYACVRKTLRSPKKARKLAYLILDLNSWEAFYWASCIRERWWRHRSVRRLYRIAKAFKTMFELE